MYLFKLLCLLKLYAFVHDDAVGLDSLLSLLSELYCLRFPISCFLSTQTRFQDGSGESFDPPTSELWDKRASSAQRQYN